MLAGRSDIIAWIIDSIILLCDADFINRYTGQCIGTIKELARDIIMRLNSQSALAL